MRVVRATKPEDIERLKPVAFQWEQTCNGRAFGIELLPEKHFVDLANLIEDEDADLFLLVNEERVVGYLGVTIFDSPIGNQKFGNEHYWYVFGANRGRGTMLLIKAAKQWAKEKGCTHFIMNASNLASNMHDKVCKFYERIGFVKFETSYIKEL